MADYVERRAELFYPEEYNAAKGLKLLSVGRLTEQKGFDMALDAAAILKNNGVDFCWFIIGKGHLQDALQKQIDTLGLNDNVKLLGQRTNPYPYIKNADIFLQPYRFEGKSIVLTEAKLLCKPIIATRYATVSDLITDGIDGILADMNGNSIAAAAEKFSADPHLCDLLCDNLRHQRQQPSEEMKENLALFELV
jgi:glycosyltransferase involved in cell wall biosynthesis